MHFRSGSRTSKLLRQLGKPFVWGAMICGVSWSWAANGVPTAPFAEPAALLSYEIEGVSLGTNPTEIKKILIKRGWRVHGEEPGLLQFHKGDVVKPGGGGSGRGGRGLPAYVSAESGHGYQISVKLYADGQKPAYVSEIALSRLPRASWVDRSTRADLSQLTLEDTLDVRVARDFKAWVCSRITDEKYQWRNCEPDTQKRIHLSTAPMLFQATSDLISLSLDVRPVVGEIRLGTARQ